MSARNTTGTRLKQAREALKMNQVRFARAVGCTQAFISQIEHDRCGPSTLVLTELAKLDISSSWLLTGQEPMRLSHRSEGSDSSDFCVRDRAGALYGLRELPLVGEVAAGLGKSISPDEIERLVPVYLAEHAGHECFASKVTGKSMEPVFFAGDLVVIDKTCPPADNDIAVVIVDDQVMLKRVSMDERDVYLLSINRSMPPIRVSRSNPDARIVGRVIQLIRSRF